MFYWSYEKENPLINICNIVTLRYAPTQRGLISLNMGNDDVKKKTLPDITRYRSIYPKCCQRTIQ